jgi:hypothetical protein
VTADQYLSGILDRETVNTGLYSPVRGVQAVLMPSLNAWAGQFLRSVNPSGSFAKGTANKSGTDIDLFISLSENTPNTLKEIYVTLLARMRESGYTPKEQNVSVNITVNGFSVDLVPAKRQDAFSQDHSIYRRKADSWTKTNVHKHISYVIAGNRRLESRVLKLWRDQKNIDFPSFYVELSVTNALANQPGGALSDNVWKVFQYLRDNFQNARIVDPANTNNIISDDLTGTGKAIVTDEARRALSAKNWDEIIK